MRFIQTIGMICALALMASVPGMAQDQKPKTGGEVAAGTWAWGENLTYVRDHFVKAAEEFPEDKYNYRPAEESRTFAEIIMHVARFNHLTASSAMGRQSEDVREFGFHSKAQALAKLKESFQELEDASKQKPERVGLGALIHTSEHYGNLAVYYRLNGLVPPASR
ncbi:MAG: DinB family protein [Candidatus Acidiferrales bacterium]